ncbi:GNAT family N-acetyltransferase [Streptomyces griseorubiginosus]|uniref:GNAT family N-acetyltransferase n=1 Tax=Streptomyces griseorubiginosus TaxID=67304 RepID=UPI002E7FE394|nr:GNAT family N-acetyltransferase [Streptomyces griseorubiginosus]WUB49199.1 GNAT family N-acetyltransferase [Streptomyces griseorubiginosus]WUB57727.1 GNAT family N-acetyltransferase [Streptomyces griseorubiginosus]
MSGDTPSVAGNGGVPRARPGLDAPRASNNSAYSQAHDGSDAPRASGGGGAPQASAGTDAPHVVDGAGGAPHAPAGPDAPHVLDNPALASLSGPHAHFAEKRGRVLRYPVDVSPWLALPDEPDAGDWADLAALAGPGAEVPLTAYAGQVPEGWEVTFHVEGVQLVDDGIAAAPEPEAVRLGPADVPEILDLIARTQPGPFLPRTIEMGTYLGIRREGALVAMAGERLRPPGWTEISAVCTDPAVRGQGLATRLILAVAHGIRERGETPFLHTGARNINAIRLYESLGFRLRRRTAFLAARVPERLPEAVS